MRLHRLFFAPLLALAGPLAAGTPSCPQATWAGDLWQSIPAASFALTGAMTYVGGGDAHFRTMGNNTNDNNNIPTCAAAGCATYAFTLGAADAGYYKLEVLVHAQNGNQDSIFVGIDGVNDTCGGNTTGSSGNPAIRRWDVQDGSTNYEWRYVTDWNNNNSFANARVWHLGAGTYTLRFIGRESDTRIREVRLRRLVTAPTPTPTPVVVPPALGTGLNGHYFQDINLGTLGGTRLDPQVNFNWGTGAPGFGGLGANNFSVRWCGQVEYPAADNYVFYTTTDDGVRLWVNGTLVIDRWADQSATEWASAPIAVTAAGRVPIVMEYYERGGDARAELRWESGSIAKQLVPANRLYNNCGAPTATPTPASGPAGTATPTPAPTHTPTPAPTIWAGLPAGKRLYGLEYIPFPEQRQGANVVHGLSVTFTTAAANNAVRNTARWRVVLQGLTLTVGSQVQVETRLGAAGEACTTGYFEPAAYASATSLALPERPQNLSTTYLWVNGQVPVTERFDAMGDPRHLPYADLLGAPATGTLQGNYNWFFKDIANAGWPDYQAEYIPFLPRATFNRYNDQPNFDVPKLFGLWREGVVASRSIYTSMTGYSSYYIGIGGEIGGDAANRLSGGGVPAYGGPWGASGSAGRDEIIGSAVIVRNATWRSLPHLGELWPDASYNSDWYSGGPMASWGNLRNNQQGGTAYRQNRQDAGVTGSYGYPQVRHRTETWGSASFMNGHGGSNSFNHFTNQFNASLLYDGQRMAQDYNFAMPATFNVNRSWGLIQGGNIPAEWNLEPYNQRRLALDIYSASQPAANYNNRGFYRRDGGNDAHQRASAAVRGIEASGALNPDGQPAAGWFVINGLAPSTDSGINFVARFAILSCLRTFHDAGVPTTHGNTRNRVNVGGTNRDFRIPAIPLVQITQPKVGQDVTGLGTIVLEWKKRNARWDRRRYTENYPCLDANQPPCAPQDPTKPENPALEWHDDAVLVFNVKYSLNGGKSWFSALTGNPAQAGVYLDGADSLAQNPGHQYQYSWNVATLEPGHKLVRVEAYRRDLGLHYAYHEMPLKTAP